LPTSTSPHGASAQQPSRAALRANTNKEVRDLLSHMELCMEDGGGPLSGSGECFGAERLEDVPASARVRKWTQTKHECIRGLGMRDFEDVYHYLKCACEPSTPPSSSLRVQGLRSEHNHSRRGGCLHARTVSPSPPGPASRLPCSVTPEGPLRNRVGNRGEGVAVGR